MFDTSGGRKSRRQHSTDGGITDVPVSHRRSANQPTPVEAALLAAFAVAFAVATAALTAAAGLSVIADRACSSLERIARGGEGA